MVTGPLEASFIDNIKLTDPENPHLVEKPWNYLL